MSKIYSYLKPFQSNNFEACSAAQIAENCKINGFEVYCDDVVDRSLNFFSNNDEKDLLIEKLNGLQVKRLHCSYWAYPTAYVTQVHFNELVKRFGGIDKVSEYYGDLIANHMFERWAQEYEIACAIQADAYTFHLIDYAPIDGAWEFTIPKTKIAQAMISILQKFINTLLEKNLITENSPFIELENAGWGLEHGTQTAQDYVALFEQIYDPFNKIRISWDLNHLLHALGEVDTKTIFMLPQNEITQEMNCIFENNGAYSVAEKWILQNVLCPELQGKIGSVQLADCVLKKTHYFTNGKLLEPYFTELENQPSWEDKENYGVEIVLTHYDSHVVVGEGCLHAEFIKMLIEKLSCDNKQFTVVHELKNTKELEIALKKQMVI